MKFNYKLIAIIPTIILLSYLIDKVDKQNDIYNLPEDYSAWEINIFSSSLYPVSVQKIHAINVRKDWTKVLMGSGYSIYTTEIKKIESIFPDYNGYGIPLNSKFASEFIQSDYGRELPEIINIYWTSISNTRFFVTKIKIDKKIANVIKTKIVYNNGNSACDPTNIDIGLLPNGDAKLWLSCAGRFRYLGKIEFSQEFEKNSDGFGPEDYKKEQREIQNRADYFGVKLFPIPYENLDKTYIHKYKIDD